MRQPHSPTAEILARIAAHWPELDGRIQPAVLHLYRARDLLFEDLERVLAPHGLRPADLDVLAALRTCPPPRQLTPTALYRALLLSSGGLTKILHRLEAAGWVDRPANPADGRSQLVRLTRRGKALVERVIEDVVRHEQRCLAGLSAAEQQQLARLLGKLAGGLEDPAAA